MWLQLEQLWAGSRVRGWNFCFVLGRWSRHEGCMTALPRRYSFPRRVSFYFPSSSLFQREGLTETVIDTDSPAALGQRCWPRPVGINSDRESGTRHEDSYFCREPEMCQSVEEWGVPQCKENGGNGGGGPEGSAPGSSWCWDCGAWRARKQLRQATKGDRGEKTRVGNEMGGVRDGKGRVEQLGWLGASPTCRRGRQRHGAGPAALRRWPPAVLFQVCSMPPAPSESPLSPLPPPPTPRPSPVRRSHSRTGSRRRRWHQKSRHAIF